MKRWVTFIAILGCLAAAPAAAQHEGHQHGEVVMAPGGVKGEWSRNLDYATEKLVQLAEAIPEDKYTWRPADGVRSVSEAFLHAAGANYGIPQFLGVKPPDGFDLEKFEKSTTKKADVIAAIKGSVEHVKAGVKGMPDADRTRGGPDPGLARRARPRRARGPGDRRHQRCAPGGRRAA
jgi:hypothetical protein